nr:hypothetical protein [Tanacetum cinerariifolium]
MNSGGARFGENFVFGFIKEVWKFRRHDLKFNDAEGTSYLPNAMIFEEFAKIGKEKKETKETEVFHTEDPVPTTSNDPILSGEDSIPLKELMPGRKEKKETKETEVFPTEDPVPTTSNDPILSGEDSIPLKELMVLDLENEVIEMKSSHKAKITELERRVEKLEEENSTAGGELNAADEEPVSDAPTNITTAQPSKATETTIDITTAPKAKGIVFHKVEESTTRTASSKAHVKDKGKAKLVEEPKVLKSRKAQIAIDAEVAKRIEAE